ncbi:MAG: YvcK family protein [Dehalobacterium sp.]
MMFLRWLYPGLGFKRWILVIIFGLFCAAEGLAVAQGSELISLLEKPFLKLVLGFTGETCRILIGACIVTAGIFIMGVGFNRLMKNVLAGLVPGAGTRWGEKLLLQHYLKKGPRIVAIGGGTGLSTLLRGLKEVTGNITAIVTVTDDGGSSGRLRGDLGMLPPGDIRNCLVALADKESAIEGLFNYRFSQGKELAGHSLGNLLLAGLTEMTGNFANAVQEVSRILAVRGRVLPVTLDNVVLMGEMNDGRIVKGETNMVKDSGRIQRVFLEPPHCTALKEAVEAIMCADAVIIGPGSLYTSLIPNLLVPGISEAIRNSKAKTYYICNIMTQPGETDDYQASHHLKAIIDHIGPGVIDKVIVNNEVISSKLKVKYQAQGAKPVKLDEGHLKELAVEVIQYPLCAQHDLARHDPEKILRVLMEEIQGNTAYLFGYSGK